jgi:hypothetical protein
MPDSNNFAVDVKASSILASLYVDVTSQVTAKNDTTEIFAALTQRSLEVLPIVLSGILLGDEVHGLQLVSSSTRNQKKLDFLKGQEVDGPCRASYLSGAMVVDRSDPTRTSALGLNVACAVPLKSRDVVVGSFGFFGTRSLVETEVQIAKALADSATIALLQSDPREDSIVLARQLREAIESRNALEQAKGVLAARFACDENVAVEQLRLAARKLGLTLGAVAQGVVARDPSTEIGQLLASRIVESQEV